jgi:hypothetical protein
MLNTILFPIIIAKCTTVLSYYGGTEARLTRSENGAEYRLVVKSVRGIDGDGSSAVLADEKTSALNAIHMEDGMMYQFDKSELEIFGVFTQPNETELDAEFRSLNARGEVIDTVKMKCDYKE